MSMMCYCLTGTISCEEDQEKSNGEVLDVSYWESEPGVWHGYCLDRNRDRYHTVQVHVAHPGAVWHAKCQMITDTRRGIKFSN